MAWLGIEPGVGPFNLKSSPILNLSYFAIDPRLILPTNFAGDVTSKLVQDNLEQGWDSFKLYWHSWILRGFNKIWSRQLAQVEWQTVSTSFERGFSYYYFNFLRKRVKFSRQSSRQFLLTNNAAGCQFQVFKTWNSLFKSVIIMKNFSTFFISICFWFHWFFIFTWTGCFKKKKV